MSDNRRRVFPLSWHLTALVLAAMIPVVVFAVLAVRGLVAAERQANERRLTRVADDLAVKFDQEVIATLRTLTAMGASESLKQENLRQFYQELQHIKSTQLQWHTVLLHSLEGKPLLNSIRPFGQDLLGVIESESFKRLVMTKQPVVGVLAVGAEGRWGIPVRVPVLNHDNEMIFVLTAVISAKSLEKIAALDEAEWTRTIVDPRGTVAARSRFPEKYVGTPATPSYHAQTRRAKTGLVREKTLDGVEVYLSFARAPFSDWVASVAVPVGILDASATRFMVTVTLVGTTLLLMFGGFAFYYSRHLAWHIRSAAQAATRLIRGEKPKVVASRVLEVEILSNALVTAAGILQQREHERNELLKRSDAARAEAEAANEAKDKFLAMLGHELRNPLGVISNGVHVMQELAPGDPELGDIQDIVVRQVGHLTKMLDDLLDASRFTLGKAVLSKNLLDFRILMRDIQADFGYRFASSSRRISFHISDEPMWILGDGTRLTQCVSNLLHNSIKFTNDSGLITLQVKIEGSFVTLTIKDDGIGIDPKVLPLLFQAFVQAPQSIDRRSGGLGLGLSVVKGILDLHGGSIAAESDGVNMGTTMVVRIPLASIADPKETSDPAKDPERRPASGTHKILVIEDIDDAAKSLAKALTLQGQDVRIANSGLVGLQVAAEFMPRVIICDIGLPDIDGFEVCRRIRARASSRDVCLIALTGYGQAEDVLKSKEAGFDFHLTKPLQIDVLIEILATWGR